MREKIVRILQTIFGYGVMICLFVGGLTFFGYLAALIIGGETAGMICTLIYNKCTTLMKMLREQQVWDI